jgi:hypothetical protein
VTGSDARALRERPCWSPGGAGFIGSAVVRHLVGGREAGS